MMHLATSPTVDVVEDCDFSEKSFIGTAAVAYQACLKPSKIVPPFFDQMKGHQIIVDTAFGGHEDPFVVSDDNIDRAALLNWQNCRNAMHSYFTKSMPDDPFTEGVVVFERDRSSEIADEYRSKFSNLLNATTIGKSSYNYAAAIASMVLVDSSKTSALFDRASYRAAYNAIKTASLKHAMMNSYCALLTPLFEEAGFSESGPYEDGLGALVVDYIKLEERVTFALDEQEAQLFYFEDGKFQSHAIKNPHQSLLAFVEFVKSKFA